MKKACDLYSGLGGTTAGALRAGVEVIWCANHNDHAVACHRANHPDVPCVQQDLAEMDWASAPRAEIMLATPACQDFSQCGQPAAAGTGGNGHVDVSAMIAKRQRDRNTTWAVLAACDSMRPERFLIENVPDLLRWELYPAWFQVLKAMGYKLREHRLNAHDYGSPQDRERVIITGSLHSEIVLAPKLDVPRLSIGDCIDWGDNGRWTEIDSKSQRMRVRMRKAQRGAGSQCFWNNVSEARGRSFDEAFPTSTTRSSGQWNILDGDRARTISARELARSMSFPDSYQLPKSKDIAGRLIGNAIDVRFAAGVIAQIVN